MTTWRDARERAYGIASALPAEPVGLAEAAGRVLARPIQARSALPGFDNAAMDGFAVRGAAPWRITGRILAGQPDPGGLAPGTAVEIATGAPVPCGADRVLPYEMSHREGDRLSATAVLTRTHIRRCGEDAAPGQVLVESGTPLSPVTVGLAASAGLDTVTVHRLPSMRLVLTGDELVTAGPPGPGQVRDALGPMLPALLTGFGAGWMSVTRVGDRPGALREYLRDIADDVVVVCGSSSVGPADGLHKALHDLGADVLVDGVACRPGHPQMLAARGKQVLVGLPGNPFAALVAAYTLVQPLLHARTGRAFPAAPAAPVRGDVSALPAQTRLVPVRVDGSAAQVVGGDRPGYLGAAASADALAVIEPGWTPATAVELLRLR